MDSAALMRIERLNYAFGAALVVASLGLGDQSFVLGVLAGVVLTCVNFSIIRRLVDKLLTGDTKTRGVTAFYFVPKMTGLLVAVSVVIYFLPVSPIGVGIGFSVFLLSILVESIRFITSATLSH